MNWIYFINGKKRSMNNTSVSVNLAGLFTPVLLLEKRNDIDEVCEIAKSQFNLESMLIMDKKIPGEHLFVFRFKN